MRKNIDETKTNLPRGEGESFDSAWNMIPEAERRRIERLVQYFAPEPVVLVYDNEEQDSDSRLDHYDMPPLSDDDCEVLFADLPLGS